jgi:ubiquinone/menaquinone biosynthesis C-methylase UbiE
MSDESQIEEVFRYYDRTESRIGYRYLLHSTKHFGWYESGDSMWNFTRSMRRMEDELGERLGLPADAEVLDVGCGVGDVARRMTAKFKLKVTGIDILDFNLEEARKRSVAAGLEDRVKFQRGNYQKLDFPDQSFDGVYAMETLVHAADLGRALSEFRRVLRPGGRLVMFEYSRAPESTVSRQANEALRKICELGAMPAWLNMFHGDMERIAQEQGFNLDSTEDVTRRMEPMLHAFSILGRFPYFVGRITKNVPKVVNAMSGVEMYRHLDAWRYNIYVAHKF